MNPAQLLNPKAFAKEQAKSQSMKRTKGKTARPQNLGPQQTRKPQTAVSGGPSYDPKSLLNPKSATGQPALKKDDSVDTDADAEYASKRMIEKLNGVVDRDEAPVRKRRVQIVDDDDSEAERKKQKAVGSQFGGGRLLSEHMDAERKRLEAESKTDAIDLTLEDETPNDKDVQIVSEIQRGTDETVILGVTHGSANMYRIPSVAQNAQNAVGKEHWPRTRITFRREVSNNTIIDLLDKQNVKFATLDVRTASALCPLLAGTAINGMRLQVWLSARPKKPEEYIGKRVSENARLEIMIKAPKSKASQIGKFLSQRQIFLTKPAGLVGDQAASYVDIQAPSNWHSAQTKSQSRPISSVQRTVEEMQRETSNMFDSLTKAEDLPGREADASIIAQSLLSHQKQALHFLMDHEREDFGNIQECPQHSLWKYKPKDNGKPAWYHLITGHEVYEKPASIKGGILADVMGLGKTLSILALIAETSEASKSFRSLEPPASDTIERNARGTLIVCPKSVLSNWQEQIQQHVLPGQFKVYLYHGANRTQDLRELSRNDVVLTTYNTVAAEMGRGRMQALSALNWFRIVLDEAHSIRTHTTQIFKGCCALEGERRWAVTGTPVQNNLNDMGALVKFLRLTPFDGPTAWSQYIMAPFKNGNVQVIEQLQILVASITLRRTKGALEQQLPNREEQRERLTFADAEAHLYKQFARKTRTQLHRISHGGNALKGKAYAHILQSISRLRMICAHGKEMLTDEDMRDIRGDEPSSAIVLDIGDEPGNEDAGETISDKLAYETVLMLAESDAAVCQNCFEKVSGLDKAEVEAEEGAPASSDDGDYDDTSDSDGINEDNKNFNIVATKTKTTLGYLTPCFHIVCPRCVDRHKSEVAAAETPDGHYECQYCQQYVRSWLFSLDRQSYRHYLDSRKVGSHKSNTPRWDENTYSGPHTKVKALLEDLRKSAEETNELAEGEPPIRSVVFSGWTSYLDLIQYALINHGIAYTRIDGSMSVKQRSQALDRFNTDNSVTVLLVSIKAGGQGLNFTAASKAYVMEPQFNPGVEQQAVDRIHRIGQKRPVTIKHYIMKGSIEEGILELQKKKEELAKLSMEKRRTKAEGLKERLAELQSLFK